MKQVDHLKQAIDGIKSAGLSPVPLEIIVPLANVMGAHIAQVRYENGRIVSANVHFSDGVGMNFLGPSA